MSTFKKDNNNLVISDPKPVDMEITNSYRRLVQQSHPTPQDEVLAFPLYKEVLSWLHDDITVICVNPGDEVKLIFLKSKNTSNIARSSHEVSVNYQQVVQFKKKS